MRKLVAFSFLGLLVCVSLGSADLVTPRKNGPAEKITGMGVRATVERFKPNEEATVILTGEGLTAMALCIFDRHGNCVARDDVTYDGNALFTIDELAVRWIPADANPCYVEVRNAGIGATAYDIAVR